MRTRHYTFSGVIRVELETKKLLRVWSEHPVSRRSIFGLVAVSALSATSVGRALGISAPVLTQVLGRPTDSSIAINLMSSQKVSALIEYGYAKSRYVSKTKEVSLSAGIPVEIELTGLKANSKIYYRVNHRITGAKKFSLGKQYSFTSARKSGETFSFSVHGDTHPERAGKMFNAELYGVTLSNVLSQQPDFHILMGDDFSIDPLISKGQATQANVEKIYSTHRNWLSALGASVPIFLVNGNHEQAAAYLLNGTPTSPAVLAGNARNKYFSLPAPNDFYTGDTSEIPGVGLARDYYSWTWGDALFITLDPYWHSTSPVDNAAGILVPEDQGIASPAATSKPKKNGGNAGTGGGNAKTSNLWSIGLGDEQYAWLKQTLETSQAKYRFVFAHHVMGTGRGAIEVSTNYEWGGVDPKGASTFAKERPNWELPIHDLMVKNKVNIFFQGHDHIFCTQERDGLIYQAMPNPADDTFSMFNSDAYKSGTKAPNSGHVRVSVSSAQAKVEYFLAARVKDAGRKNLQLAHSYVVKPKV